MRVHGNVSPVHTLKPSSGPSLSHRPIALLGGSGFLGTRLARLLLSEGREVRIGDLAPSRALPALWRPCDVRSVEACATLLRGAEAVVNLAAEHRDDVRPISRYRETNVEGAVSLCQAARQTGVRTLVYISSAAVYGLTADPAAEDAPCAPCTPYGRSKLEAEAVYRRWAQEDPSRSLVILRPAVVFGEGNRGNVHTLIRQIAAERFLMVGSGRNRKSMAYAGNVAAFMAHCLGLGPGAHILNYADGPDLDTGTLVRLIRRSLGLSPRVVRIPLGLALAGGHLFDLAARLSGLRFPISAVRVRKFCASTQLSAEKLKLTGFQAPYSLREALLRTLRAEIPVRGEHGFADAPVASAQAAPQSAGNSARLP